MLNIEKLIEDHVVEWYEFGLAVCNMVDCDNCPESVQGIGCNKVELAKWALQEEEK